MWGRWKRYLAAALFLALVPVFAAGDKIDRLGQATFLGQYGAWYMGRTLYVNGDKLCWATTAFRDDRPPTVSVVYGPIAGNPSLVFRIDGAHIPKGGATATMIIGKETFDFVHLAKFDHTGYFPVSSTDRPQILAALLALSKAKARHFKVTFDNGTSYRFNAHGFDRALKKVMGDCAGK